MKQWVMDSIISGNFSQTVRSIAKNSHIASAVVLAAACLPAQALEFSGIVVENTRHGVPLSDVMACLVSLTNSRLSDQSGVFTLLLPPGVSAGYRVRLNLERHGFEIVNGFDMEFNLPSDFKERRSTPQIFILCRNGERQYWAARYYRLLARQTIMASYEEKMRMLQKTNSSVTGQVRTLANERARLIALADSLSEQLAMVKWEETSSMYREAFRLFKAGRLDEARRVLDDTVLSNRVSDAKKAIIEAAGARIASANRLVERGDSASAEAIFRELIKTAPMSMEAFGAYAEFLNGQKRYKEALDNYRNAVILARAGEKNEGLAAYLSRLGDILISTQQNSDAFMAVNESLDIWKSLAVGDVKRFPNEKLHAILQLVQLELSREADRKHLMTLIHQARELCMENAAESISHKERERFLTLSREVQLLQKHTQKN